jgi:hypothetical protein
LEKSLDRMIIKNAEIPSKQTSPRPNTSSPTRRLGDKPTD